MASEPKLVLAKKLYANKALSIEDICQTLKISRLTYYRYVETEWTNHSGDPFLTNEPNSP